MSNVYLCWTSLPAVRVSLLLLHKTSLSGLNPTCKVLFIVVLLIGRSCVRFFCDSVTCSPPSSSVHGISQARILEWVAIPSSKGSSQPRDLTCVSLGSCTAGRFLSTGPPGKFLDLFCFQNGQPEDQILGENWGHSEAQNLL